jgi:ring-1,2-phenylacetyl-CoA epoxidase subunit PaaE
MGEPPAAVPVSSRGIFHALRVAEIQPAAEDGSALALTLHVPSELRERFAFQAGQHVTARITMNGSEVRRSYSLCGTPEALRQEGILRLGIRVIIGGAFSAYLGSRLSPGDLLDLAPPLGGFTAAVSHDRVRRYAAVVAGAGITPVLSLVSHALAVEPESAFTVLYGNRTARSAMFLEELADLKDRYRHRLQLVYCFSRETRSAGAQWKRLDDMALTEVLGSLVMPSAVDEWFVCGPHVMVRDVTAALERAGVPAPLVHRELFWAGEDPVLPTREPSGDRNHAAGEGLALTVRLDGRTSTLRVPSGTTLLEAALTIRPELPFSCRTGVCGTCRARLVAGAASMRHDHVLTSEEKARRYVLTCQAVASSCTVSIDYDV